MVNFVQTGRNSLTDRAQDRLPSSAPAESRGPQDRGPSADFKALISTQQSSRNKTMTTAFKNL